MTTVPTPTGTGPNGGGTGPENPQVPGSTGSNHVLDFRDASKQFRDGTVAMVDVSFSVAAGEFVSIVGPSGCGKSTLLRLASRLDVLSGGSVDVATDELGYVFQDATLLPWRTVEKNVGLLLELRNAPKETRASRVRAAIELTGLSGFEDNYPHTLSGGMKMRASLARSMTTDPKLFLFDEPFGALDEMTRERLNEELLLVFARERFAGVFITHSVSEAVFMATRVLVMSARPGRIVADVAVPFAYPRPADLRFDPEFTALCADVSHHLRASAQ